jgi:large subunit ribosomal protein L25
MANYFGLPRRKNGGIYGMTEKGTIKYVLRTCTKKSDNGKLEADGYLLGNISGKGKESVSVAVKKDEFRRALSKYGRNKVFRLVGPDKKEYTVIIKSIQISPMAYSYHHVDFQQVSLTDEVKEEVFIKLVGADIVEAKRLIINKQLEAIPITGLPDDIPDGIEINVSDLKSGDSVYIKDIKFSKGIHADMDPNRLVLSVNEPKVQAEEEAEEAETEEKAE